MIVVLPAVVPKSGVIAVIFGVLSLLYSTAFVKVISLESLYFITASHIYEEVSVISVVRKTIPSTSISAKRQLHVLPSKNKRTYLPFGLVASSSTYQKFQPSAIISF